MRLNIILLFCSIGLSISTWAQNPNVRNQSQRSVERVTNQNPTKNDAKISTVPTDSLTPDSIPVAEKATVMIDSTNPFEILDLPVSRIANSDSGKLTKLSRTDSAQHGFQFPVINAPKKSQNFLFILLLIYFGLLTALVTLNRSLLGKIVRGFFNENYMRMIFRVQNPSVYLSYALIYLFFLLNAGLFIYLFFKRQNILGARTDLALYFWCVLGVAAIYGIKHLTLRIIGAIFPVNKEIQFFSFTLLIFNSLLGVLLLPLNAVLAFSPEWLSKYMIPLGLILFILVYFYRQLRGLLIGSKYLTGNTFHFFVYLCTVEIAPIIILVKLVHEMIQL